jgi:DNA-binding winged helix-turn-helix (wHTH) protein
MRVQFAGFTFDTGARQLCRDDQPIQLSGKAFGVLRVLLERRPDVVSKKELLQEVWPDTWVEESNLSVAVSELRRALADDAQRPRFIRTDFRTGYAFIAADAIDLGARRREDRPRATSRFWLVWSGRRLVLYEGENIIGRDPQCSLWVDESHVSGQHARLTVSAGQVTVEDLGSTNGTFLRGSRVTVPQPLADGDVIRFGATDVTFKIHQPKTKTVARVDERRQNRNIRT